ncbi:RHS repeat-associated core domain-containing protein [Streptomyces sp. NBRC 110465]|uniref:RHS repeat-associated core domain-containing protein n=1 Tax=Streptomyces sp. NBRC 110465 TaxID=1897621 RepID=UPI0009A0D2F8|nr:RHS repeat-associated core domain-containing protein [Streptomyces sp. NBRC 110465]
MTFGIPAPTRPPGRTERRRARFRARPVATVLSLLLAIPAGLTPVAAAAEALGRPDVPDTRPSKVEEVSGRGAKKDRARVVKERKADGALARKASAERRASWPSGGKATVDLVPGESGAAKPGGLPVSVSAGKNKTSAKNAGGAVEVTVLDQDASRRVGITGVLLTAAAEQPGQADLRIDYRTIASAVGGGWGGRLRLVQLPDCALTTPEKAKCRAQTPVKSANDLSAHTLTAAVSLDRADVGGVSTQSVESGSVFALTASGGSGPSASGTGNYAATPLAASSSWEAGKSSGSFSWSHDFPLPSAAAGPAPSLSLSYDSGSIDGRTATSNNQGSATGEGFSITESYVERAYGSCDKDGHSGLYDQCWKYDNASLVLNGKSSKLVKDATTGAWRLSDDDASKVIRSTGADNGDDNGEYWTVTTGDGTKYVFGLNKFDGATTQRTNSAWTVPVFGDDSGEPGYSKGSTFADRWATQAWRWNLDYVEDPYGNAATYWYTTETNHYPRNKATTANASYTRGGYLKEIQYGLRADALFTDKADAKVTFAHAERCTAADCGTLTEATAENWPDVPFDALCAKDAADCYTTSPSFFSRKRLTGVNTFTWNASTTAYDPVDSWKLTQQYLDGGDIGDSSDQVLTLKSLQRTAKAGTAKAVTPVTFTYQLLPNRVDATDDILPLTRPRISTVTSETGAITTVTLSAPECVRSEVLGAAEDTNTRNCYPQYWNINGAQEASIDWFHKYRVLAVTTSDPAGHNETVENSYSYAGAAWHHSDSPFTPKAERTWSDWRGYRQVTVHSGAKGTTQPQHKTVSLYMQGMNGDKNKDGTTKSVKLAPLTTPSVGIATLTDSDQYSGQLREKVVYNGTQPISVTANQPWSKETARQTGVPDSADHVARYVRTKQTTTYTYLTASDSWRRRAVQTTFDGYGMPVTVYDSGLYGTAGDETCTRTWYARNTAAGLTDLVSRSRTVGEKCTVDDADLGLPADTGTRGDVLSDTATVYDDPNATTWTEDQTPTKGLATWTGRAKSYTSTGAPSWQTLATETYDVLGRTLSTTDSAGHTSSTAYTPATAGPLTRTIKTDAKGFRTVDFLDPRRAVPVRSYDANLKKTERTYDALGRLTAVWGPNRSKSGGQAATTTFTYRMQANAPSWVASSSLKADGTSYNTSYALYDALLRPLQTQAPSPQGGRLLTDTRYDSRGHAYETYTDIFDPTTLPNGTYTRAEYGEAPTQTETVFDGAGRTVSSTLLVYGVKKWTTTTSYTGDSTATSAVQGGTATRTITDARGRMVESREYTSTSPADPQYGGTLGNGYASVKYTYTLDDKKRSITGPDGAKWTYGYDLFGRQTTTGDPDKGTSTTEYDALDQPVKTTDARGTAVLTAYDELGRETGTWNGSKTDANQLTARTYDGVFKGLPDSTTRYVGGKTGAAYTKSVTAYDSLSRPTGTRLTLPSNDPLVTAGAPATVDFTSYYNIDGTLQNSSEPALGGLPSEIVDYGYNGLGNVTSVTGTTGYLRAADYSALGQVQQLTLGTGGSGAKNVYVTNTYEQGTGRLTRSHVTDQTHPYMLQDLTYGFDDAGNITSIADPTTLGGSAAAETQCFAHDGHRRLTEAWTPSSQKCSDTRSATALGGPAPYWTSWSYNDAGQRTRQTQHTAAGVTATDYCYTGAKPHTLTGTSSNGCALFTPGYAYDATGNTTKRPGTTGSQDLAWSPEGKLTKVTESGKDTDYLYDADGTLLIRATESGERVLHLGATELRLKADGTTWAKRTYDAAGQTIAVRTNESGTQKLFYLAGDHHGTQSLAIASDTQAPLKRRSTPFGAHRGTTTGGDWPTDSGFLGNTADKRTGLTHIGAREYDPSTGQFISVDPLLALDQPQSLNGYSYANNSPVTFSDPDGLRPLGPTGEGIDRDNQWAKDRGMDAGYTYDNGKWNWKQTPRKDPVSQKKYASYQANPTTYLISDGAAQQRATQQRAARQKALDEAKAKAEREQRKKDGVWGSLMKGNFSNAWDNTKDNVGNAWGSIRDSGFGQWVGDHWRGLAQIGAFAVCVAASAGLCFAAGVALWAADNYADYRNGNFSGTKALKGAAWTLAGGALGRGIAGSWGAWRSASAFSRGPAGAAPALWRGSVRPQGARGAVNWAVSGRDMAVNAGITWSTCGAGSLSAAGRGC